MKISRSIIVLLLFLGIEKSIGEEGRIYEVITENGTRFGCLLGTGKEVGVIILEDINRNRKADIEDRIKCAKANSGPPILLSELGKSLRSQLFMLSREYVESL